jgi:hypothetical protein
MTLENLGQFLGAYFHQDWTLESADAEGVLRRFAAEESPAAVRQVCDEIGLLLSRGLGDEGLSRVIHGELGSYYDPAADGLTAGEWLRHVEAFLREQVDGKRDTQG